VIHFNFGLHDVRLLPAGECALITAHDVLPRRTAHRPELWRRLYGRFRASRHNA